MPLLYPYRTQELSYIFDIKGVNYKVVADIPPMQAMNYKRLYGPEKTYF
jgi:hypothetical protein